MSKIKKIKVKKPKKFSIRCPACNQLSNTVEHRPLNTLYEDPESNWITSCVECFMPLFEYYEELWAAHYEGRMCVR